MKLVWHDMCMVMRMITQCHEPTGSTCPEYFRGECIKFSFDRCRVSDRRLGITAEDIEDTGIMDEPEEV